MHHIASFPRIVLLDSEHKGNPMNGTDILAAIGDWSGSGNGDGPRTVDVIDLLAIVGAWGGHTLVKLTPTP